MWVLALKQHSRVNTSQEVCPQLRPSPVLLLLLQLFLNQFTYSSKDTNATNLANLRSLVNGPVAVCLGDICVCVFQLSFNLFLF